MTHEILRVGIIGYGNVGSHLSNILSRRGDISLYIYNRSKIHPSEHPKGIAITRDLIDLSGSDLVIIAVKDDAIVPILEQIEDRFTPDTIVCHCSGSISSKITQPYFHRYGILYPLQTFSRGKEIDYSEIPVFITGSDPDTLGIIRRVAGFISPNIREINDDQRISLHIAAIFCCNYTNALYAIGQKICKDHGLEFNHLFPLIEETAQKILRIEPKKAQTGPAVRGDWEIIHKHETYLAGYNPEINDLYRQLADYINKNL